jgi:hypothetical protein
LIRSFSLPAFLSAAMVIGLALGVGTAHATPAQEAELEKLDPAARVGRLPLEKSIFRVLPKVFSQSLS